jgi:hypothetical protein
MMKSRWDFRREGPPIIPLGFWEGMAQSFHWDFGGNAPNYSIGISEWNVPRLFRGFWKGITPIIPLGFLVGIPPDYSIGILGGHTPHNFVEISGGNNPKNYVGDGSINDAAFPIRGSPKARPSFSPMVAASAATLGMGIAEIATLKALHQCAPRIVATDMKSRRIAGR